MIRRAALALLIAFALLAPAAADTSPVFTVFFDFNSTTLGPVARGIVKQAAAAAQARDKAGTLSHVKVVGYADAAGAAGPAQALSEARAASVKRLLVAAGLPADRVRVEGRGKAAPAVPTADRVSEPRNRRAQIVLYAPGE